MPKPTSLSIAALTSLAFLVFSASSLLAQDSSIALANARPDSGVIKVLIAAEPPPMPLSSKAIIAGFLKSEAETRDALNQHTFKRDVVLQTIGPNGVVTGEYVRQSQFLFDDRGNRIEHVLYHPSSTIRELRITKEDIQDLAGAQLLGVDVAETTKYLLSFVSAETIGSRSAFVIDVAPAKKPDSQHMKERFFIGRLWIDADTFRVIKVKGTVEPQGKQRFPIFETWRAPVTDALVFPNLTTADDTLRFPNRDVHYRVSVKYYDYKRFASKVTLTEIDSPIAE
ncbi:MAG: hypothetical protein ABJB61_11000 [bacterium]